MKNMSPLPTKEMEAIRDSTANVLNTKQAETLGKMYSEDLKRQKQNIEGIISLETHLIEWDEEITLSAFAQRMEDFYSDRNINYSKEIRINTILHTEIEGVIVRKKGAISILFIDSDEDAEKWFTLK